MAGRSKPPKEVQLARLQVEERRIQSQDRFIFWDGLFSTLRSAIRWGGVVLCMGFVFLSARALAGSRTEVILTMLASMSADRYVAYSIAALSGAGFMFQRRANKRLAEKKEDYIRELEKRIDPKRSSSRLDKRGMPNEEDIDGA